MAYNKVFQVHININRKQKLCWNAAENVLKLNISFRDNKTAIVVRISSCFGHRCYQENRTYPWLLLVVRGLECSCAKSRRGAGGGAVAAGTGSSATTGGAGGQGGATDTGDVGRTTPLLRGVAGSPVTTRTDTGDFGSSSVNKDDTSEGAKYATNYLGPNYDYENLFISSLTPY